MEYAEIEKNNMDWTSNKEYDHNNRGKKLKENLEEEGLELHF